MTTRATADLRPGDTVCVAGPTVRTLRENIPPRTGSRWHVLRWEDGSSFWSACDDSWELTEPQADAWDQGEAAGRANAETERRHGTLPVPPHLYVRNPYRG